MYRRGDRDAAAIDREYTRRYARHAARQS
jgi:hypothetical protein